MPDRRAQEMTGLSRLPAEVPGDDILNVPPLSRRVVRPRNVVSFLLALVVLYLVYRELLGLDWGEVWTSIRGANAGLFALAFAILYCSLFFRALRWKVLLGNVGYDRATRHPMLSTFGLARIATLWGVSSVLCPEALGVQHP